MRRVRAGPEREAAIQRMRDRWTVEEAELRRAQFAILGLAPPFPNPVGLGSLETVNGQVTSVGLQYGMRDPAPSPLVTVCTAPASGERWSLPVADKLRDLLRECEDSEQPLPPSTAVPETEEVLLDGVPLPLRTVDNGRAWAAIAEPRVDEVELVVTIAARGWPLSGLALTRVDDLEPFLAGRRERVEALLARAGSQPGPEDWELPPASGLAGHEALVDMMIESTQERMAASGLLPNAPLPSGYAARWEVATRAQMALAGQPRDEAEDAIHSMVNHLCQLAESASWFTSSGLADKAIAETLGHVAYGRAVPSAEAQEAWARYWAVHHRQPPDFTALSSARESWQAAWQHWVELVT